MHFLKGLQAQPPSLPGLAVGSGHLGEMPLTAEQEARMRANREAAKAKLAAKAASGGDSGSPSNKRVAAASPPAQGPTPALSASDPRLEAATKMAPKPGTLSAFFSGGAKAAKRPKTASAPASSSSSSSSSSAVAEVFSAADLDASWRGALASEFGKSYWRALNSFLASEYAGRTPIFPPRADVFRALALTRLEDVKVVVLGQDPYHGPGQAHGLAFSVQRGVATPPSLRNMFAEAYDDLGAPLRKKPPHGNLEAWAAQGVLLLNTCLTVRKAQANSHQKQGWESFTDAIVREVGRRCEGVVFLLWGKPAAKKCERIDRKKHHVLTSSHPSPLAYTKTNEPFKGSKVFSRTNALLEKMGKTPINWAN